MMKHAKGSTGVPDNLSQTLTVAKYELLNYRRSRRFLLLFLVVALIGAVGTLGVAYLSPVSMVSNASTFFGLWLENSVWLVIVLPAAFLGGDAISSEFQNKTAYSMVGNPVLRSSLYLGKWIAAFVASFILLTFFEAVTICNGLYYCGSVPAEFWLSFLFSAIYLAAALSVAFLFSSLFKNSSFPVLFSGALLLLGFNAIVNFLLFDSIEPWFILTYAEQVISKIFIVPYPEHAIVSASGLVSYTVTVPQSLAIMAIYGSVSVAVGYLVFRTRDIT